jgi:hypothetical protein
LDYPEDAGSKLPKNAGTLTAIYTMSHPEDEILQNLFCLSDILYKLIFTILNVTLNSLKVFLNSLSCFNGI